MMELWLTVCMLATTTQVSSSPKLQTFHATSPHCIGVQSKMNGDVNGVLLMAAEAIHDMKEASGSGGEKSGGERSGGERCSRVTDGPYKGLNIHCQEDTKARLVRVTN